MKKSLLFVFFAIIVAANLSYGQSHRELPIYRNFNGTAPDSTNTLDSTDINYGGWSIQSVTGAKPWYIGRYNLNYYIHGNGYAATGQTAEEQWFISPGFSTIAYPDATLKFTSCQKFAGSPIQVMVSTNYDGVGLPATAIWNDITSSLTLPPTNLSGPRVWVNSGNASLSSYVGANVYVAFKYTCDATSATDWEVDSISIINNTVGFNNINALINSISLYPNPASSVLYLKNLEGVDVIRVSNIIGETVESITVSGNNTTLDVSALKKGLYFISFLNQNSVIASKKITIE